MGSGNSKTLLSKGTKNEAQAGKGSEFIPNVKIVVVGDSEVGKTSIVNRYIRNQFSPMYIPTNKVIIDTIVSKINVPDHSVVSVTFWDLPSYEDIDLQKTYFRNMDAAIVVTDINDKISVEMAHVRKQEICNKSTSVQVEDNSNKSEELKQSPLENRSVPVLLLGNKYDMIEELIDERSKLTADDLSGDGNTMEEPECVKTLQQIADDHGFIGSFPVSARNNDSSVHGAIQALIRHVLENKCMFRKHKLKDNSVGNHKHTKNNEFHLHKTGILEIDQVYDEVNKVMKNIRVLIQCYDLTLNKFKKLCSKICKLHDDCSIEECIEGLRNHTEYGNNIQYVKDREKVLELSNEDEIKTDEFKRMECCVECFNNEVVMVCMKMKTNFSIYKLSLDKFKESLSIITENPAVDSSVQNNTPSINMNTKKLTSLIEENHAKIQKGIYDTVLYQKEAQAVFSKVESAFAWQSFSSR